MTGILVLLSLIMTGMISILTYMFNLKYVLKLVRLRCTSKNKQIKDKQEGIMQTLARSDQV